MNTTNVIDRARAAAAELRACLEAATTTTEREQVAAVVAELTGAGGSIAELADQALAEALASETR